MSATHQVGLPTPTYVNECPDWCTFDHNGATSCEAGEHIRELVEASGGACISIVAVPGEDVEVYASLPGQTTDTWMMPVDHASEQLVTTALSLLAAAHRVQTVVRAHHAAGEARELSYAVEHDVEAFTAHQGAAYLAQVDQ